MGTLKPQNSPRGRPRLQQTIIWPDNPVFPICPLMIFTGVDPQHTWDLSTYHKSWPPYSGPCRGASGLRAWRGLTWKPLLQTVVSKPLTCRQWMCSPLSAPESPRQRPHRPKGWMWIQPRPISHSPSEVTTRKGGPEALPDMAWDLVLSEWKPLSFWLGPLSLGFGRQGHLCQLKH